MRTPLTFFISTFFSTSGLSVCCFTLLVAFALPTTQTHAAEPDTQQQLERLRKDIKAVEENITAAQNDQTDVIKQLKLIDIHISKLTQLIRRTDADLNQQQARLRTLKRKKSDLTGQIAQYRQHLAMQLRSSHALGQREYLKILLSSQNPVEISRMLTYLDYLSRKQLDTIRQAKSSYTDLQQTESRIDKQRKMLTADQDLQQKDLIKVNQSKQQRSKLVASLGLQISTNQQKLQALKNNQTRLTQLLHQVVQDRTTLSPIQPGQNQTTAFNKLKGKLPLPTSGKIIRKFGQTQTGDLTSKGLIFSAPTGQAVRAVAAGEVIYSAWLRGFGMLLIIDHGKQYMSLYGQNTSLHKEVGDWVASQEIIASTGESDGVQESGLYFELRHKGQAINPAKWLKR